MWWGMFTGSAQEVLQRIQAPKAAVIKNSEHNSNENMQTL